MNRYPAQFATKRLILRPPSPNDAVGVLNAVTASYAELNRWMSWARTGFTIDEARQFCADARLRFDKGEDFIALLILPNDQKIIGCASLLARDPRVPSFELTYWLHTEFVGCGYVTEAARTLTQFAFDNLAGRRVEIRMDGNNRRSWAVAKRLGFQWEATLKSYRRDNRGQLSDWRIYAMFDGEDLTAGRTDSYLDRAAFEL
ncbi:MAG: GNAT family N-acetyltransferase [Gammaproteobacteria bacterium]|nr:GNAT family N-acetyltransferase [Gammaproteobacteria bacterium]MYE51799.1 GNAT family N-acetyltransferase [Gammaproteobacteria bacterium]MYF49223.1 GNAT family N-acetyltransferase [Gammaproteobacteria bacterium]